MWLSLAVLWVNCSISQSYSHAFFTDRQMNTHALLIVASITVWVFCVLSLFCCSILSVVYSFAIISLGKKELVV